MTLPVLADSLADLSRRFLGVDVQFRRNESSWPQPWRARMVTSKNERAEYRIAAYGTTATEAVLNLTVAVARIDEENARP